MMRTPSVTPRLHRLPGLRRLWLVSGLAAVITAVLVLAQAQLLATILAGVVTGVRAPGMWVMPLAVLAIVLALRALLAWGREEITRWSAATVKHRLRRSLLEHIGWLGPVRLAGQSGGRLATLIGPGLDGLDAYLAGYLPQAVAAAVVPVAVLVRIALADWSSALVIALTLPLIPIFGVLVGRHTQLSAGRQWRLLARLGGHFLDVVRGLPTLLVFGRAQHQATVVRQMAQAHRAATMRALRTAFLSALVLELVSCLSVALVAVPIGLRLLDGRLELYTGLLVLLLAPEAYRPLRAVGTAFHAAAAGRSAAHDAFAVIDEATDECGGAPLRRGQAQIVPGRTAPVGTIALRDLTVHYPGSAIPALRTVSLEIAEGERVALIGPSGAGKSTLLAVLLGFLTPLEGEATLGGTDLRELLADPDALQMWRRQVAWVPQRPHLFAATIAENIALGDAQRCTERIEAAARSAAADEFIRQLRNGYATVLGDRGTGLSAGQRQRLALARAFYRDAPVLLLDEPTAGLDAISEAAVIAATRRLMIGRTVLVATHRRSLLSDINRVLPVRAGQLRESTDRWVTCA